MLIWIAVSTLSAFAGPVEDATAPLTTWLSAAEARDVDGLDDAFFPEAVQIVRMGDKTFPITLGAYKDMMKAGKVGGAPMTLTITAVAVDGDVASVSARRESDALVFHDAVSLLRGDDGWRIVGASVVAESR